MSEFLSFTWAHGSQFYTIFLVALFAVLIAWTVRASLQRADAFGLKTRGSALFKNYSRPKKWVKALLFILGILLLWLGLLRPQKDEDEEKIQAQGRDVVIALDISRSMLAKDMEGDKVDRLTFAKKKIRSLIAQLGADRVSLILFAGSAFIYCPLTADHKSFLAMLEDIDTTMIASGSTSIKRAIEKSLEVFELVPERKSKVLILCTDGEDFSPDLSMIKKRVQDQGLTVFTVGVGTMTGAPIPVYNNKGQQTGFQQDVDGSVIISKLDQNILEAIARDSGGQYITATADGSDIKQLERLLDRFEREQLGERSIVRKKEYYQYLAVLSGLLLLIEWVL